MGYNTTVVVLNDRLNEIERDPEFGKKLVAAIRHFSRNHPDRIPYITGQTQVLNVEHADAMQIMAIGGNTGRALGYGRYDQDDDALLAAVQGQRKWKRGIDARAARERRTKTGLTEREENALSHLDGSMGKSAMAIGRYVYDNTPRNQREGSNLSAIGAAICGRLRKRGLAEHLPDTGDWRITAAGRAALAGGG